MIQNLCGGAIIAALCLALGGCSTRPPGLESPGQNEVVLRALSALGAPYRYGGESPDSGFDCSGLVRYAYADALKRDLPRRSEDMANAGQVVDRRELRPGDLLFFNTLQRSFSHVAIYIGDGRFIHAPTARGKVRIEALTDRYWAGRFDGARRVLSESVALQ